MSMIKSSRVLNQSYTPYCILYSCLSVFETLSNTEVGDISGTIQTIFNLSNKYPDKGGTTPGFFEALKVEGLNGFKIKDYKILNSVAEVKQWLDKGFPVICDFKEIWGIPYHTAVAEAYNDLELYVKNSYGVEWGNGGYEWSGVNIELIRAYVAIPFPVQENQGYTGWIQFAPLDKMEITQPYGKTAFAIANPDLYKAFGGIHPGWDLAAGIGTPVYSAETKCKVIWAGWDNGWGNLVKTEEGNRILYYAHLNQIIVKVGDILGRGQQIGFSGNTGQSFGGHLHYGIWLTDLNSFVDPFGFPLTSLPR